MKKIGIIADTHFSPTQGLHPTVSSFFSDVSLILHAGDVGDSSEYKKLKKIAPVLTVMGNKTYDARTYHFPQIQSLKIYSVPILLSHYQGSKLTHYAEYLVSKFFGSKNLVINSVIDRLRRTLKVNSGIVIFGHTHEICLQRKNGITFLNSGAAFSTKTRAGSIAKLLIHKNGKYEITFKYLDPLIKNNSNEGAHHA
jgi:putative phosphoesterase